METLLLEKSQFCTFVVLLRGEVLHGFGKLGMPWRGIGNTIPFILTLGQSLGIILRTGDIYELVIVRKHG